MRRGCGAPCRAIPGGLGWALGSLWALLAASWVMLEPGDLPSPPRPTRAEAYPRPVSAPEPSATPDADGYLAPPEDLPFTIVSWSDSRVPAILADLRTALRSGSTQDLSGRVTRRFDLGLTPVDHTDSEAGVGLRSSGAERLLDAMFAAGAGPILQGFFEPSGLAEGPRCLIALSHPWPADVAHPPVPTPPIPSERHGALAPRSIEPDAAAFRLCADSLGDWVWMDWWHGPYAHLLRQWHEAEPQWNATYRVLRP